MNDAEKLSFLERNIHALICSMNEYKHDSFDVLMAAQSGDYFKLDPTALQNILEYLIVYADKRYQP